MNRVLIGDTIKFTWISSGSIPSDIHAATYNGDETLVNSVTMTSSGNGHYFSNYTIPSSSGFFTTELDATVGGNPYRRRIKFKVTPEEVD